MKAILPESDLPRVVIIGGGYGGIMAAQGLKNAPFQIVMIDRNNYHAFQPLLYQVASGGLEPDSIAFPLRKMFAKQRNLHFRMAEVQNIDPEKKCIDTSIGSVIYDYLILATGSKTNFFGNKEMEENAVGMKSIPEALDLRSLILQNFERAHDFSDVEDQDKLMGFVVVGGGPTGVETAGALAELKAHVLPSDYPDLDLNLMDIHLIEAGDRLLKSMSEKSSENALKSLKKLGVHVHLGTLATQFDGEKVTTKDGEVIDASTLIWAAGVQGAVIDGVGKAVVERANRLKVDAYNRVEGYEDIYAVGDIALMQTEDYPRGHPMVAPVAMQMGSHISKNFIQMSKGAPLKPFKYFDKGSMATIGRNKAVLDVGKLHLRGFVAWLGWMFVHILYLIGFRNKVVVFVNWVWSYFTYDKGTRLIIRPFRKKKKKNEENLITG